MAAKKYMVVFLIVSVLMTISCAVHKPQPIEVPAPLPDSYLEQREAVPSSQLPEEWWKIFNDPKLDSLMETAFKDNLDLAQAFARLDQSRALEKSAGASRWPYMNFEGQVSRSSEPTFLGDTTGTSHRLSAAAGYEIDLWNKLRSRTDAASLDVAATEEDLKALYISLSAQLADLYYLAVEQRAQLELTDRTTASFQDALDRVESRYRVGVASPLDVYQARQNLATATSRRPVFEAGLAGTEHAISVILGKYPRRDMAGELAVVPETPDAFPAGLPSELLSRRPDINSALLRLKASDERIAAAVADRFPSFNILANYGSSTSAFPTGDITGTFWNILLNAVMPIIDGGKRKAEVERTRAAFQEKLAFYHQTVLNAFKEVEDALADNRATEMRIRKLEEQVAASSAASRLAMDRYLMGISDYLPVLSAQQALFNAESALLASRRELISSRIQLARALGGDWMAGAIKQYGKVTEKKEETE